jgi:hypothetical protein
MVVFAISKPATRQCQGGLEKSEDVRGSVICLLGGGRSGVSQNPNHDGTDSVLLVLAVGDKTSCLDGRVANLPSFQELADLGSDSVPDSIEQHVEPETGLNGKSQVWYRCRKKIRDSPESSGCSDIVSIACTTNPETPTSCKLE